MIFARADLTLGATDYLRPYTEILVQVLKSMQNILASANRFKLRKQIEMMVLLFHGRNGTQCLFAGPCSVTQQVTYGVCVCFPKPHSKPSLESLEHGSGVTSHLQMHNRTSLHRMSDRTTENKICSSSNHDDMII